MTQYALDADILIALGYAAGELRLADAGPWPVIITDVVWDELSAPGDPQARTQKLAKAIARTATPLVPASVEAQTFVSLQQPPKTEGPGEHSVIAYCHHHPEVIAVLQDKAALRRAVEELRGRVLSFHGFLGALAQEGWIGWEEAGDIAARYRKQYSHARLPIWWRSGCRSRLEPRITRGFGGSNGDP